MSLDQLLAWVARRAAPKRSSRDRFIPTGCRVTSPSSWMATDAGRASGICRASKAIAPASTRCATSSRRSARLGLEVLTLYAFSVENWKRPAAEVSTLMMLLKRYLRSELSTLLKNDIRFNVIGRVRRARAGHPAGAARRRGEDGAQHRHAVQHRAQLRRAHRDRRRGAARDRGRHRPDALDEQTLRRVAVHRTASPIRIC